MGNNRALARRDVSGKATGDEDENDSADLGKIVNLMQYVSLCAMSGVSHLACTGAMRTPSLTGSGSSRVFLQHLSASRLPWCSCTGEFFDNDRCGVFPLMPRRILGWSSLAAVGVVVVAYVLNYPLAKYNIYVRSFFA